MKNTYFPQWETASRDINLLLEHFKPYVIQSEDDKSTLILTFIHPDDLWLIPEEYESLFDKIYNVYMQWFSEHIDLSSIFKRYEYYQIEKDNMHRIEFEVQQSMLEYENCSRISLKQCLSACLGEGIYTIPTELKNKLIEFLPI